MGQLSFRKVTHERRWFQSAVDPQLMATSWKLLVSEDWIPRGLVPSVRVVPEIDNLRFLNGRVQHLHSSQFSSGVDTWRMPAASSFNGHGLLEEGPVTNFIVLPYYHGDEAVLWRP